MLSLSEKIEDLNGTSLGKREGRAPNTFWRVLIEETPDLVRNVLAALGLFDSGFWVSLRVTSHRRETANRRRPNLLCRLGICRPADAAVQNELGTNRIRVDRPSGFWH